MLRKIFSSRTSLGACWALEATGGVLSRNRKLSSSAQVTEFLATTTKKVRGVLVDNSRWNQLTPSVRKWTKGELSFLRPGVRGEIDKTEVLSNSSLFKVKTREETKLRKSMEDLDVAACLFTSMHNTAYFSNFVYCSFGRPYGLVTKRIFWDVWFYDTVMITFASFNFICYCSYGWSFNLVHMNQEIYLLSVFMVANKHDFIFSIWALRKVGSLFCRLLELRTAKEGRACPQWSTADNHGGGLLSHWGCD